MTAGQPEERHGRCRKRSRRRKASTKRSGRCAKLTSNREREAAAARGDPGGRAGSAVDRRLLAGVQLPVGRDDLPPGQPAAEGAAAGRARQAPAARPLGVEPCALLRVGAPQPDDPRARPRHDLRGGPGARRAGCARPGVSRGNLLRDLPRQERGRGGLGEVLQAVLLPRAHRQPRDAGDAGLDPRGRRARVQPLALLRDGARQPGPDRRVRGGRRRGRDRAARDGLALEQVPEPRPRRRGPADPEPERLQDLQPDHPRPRQPRGAGGAVRRLRLHAVLRRGQRSGGDAREDGGHPGAGDRRDPRAPEDRPRIRQAVPAALADDRAPVAQGMDGARRGQGPQGRGLVALAPGPVRGRAGEPGQPEAAGGLAPQLQARGALRRLWPAQARAEGAGSPGRPPHERQSPRQRRAAQEGPEAPRFPEVRGRGPRARHRAAREHPAPRRVPARRAEAEPDQLPRVRAGRDGLQPPAGGLRGDQEDVDGRHASGGRRRG